jgi:hypothetical protein
MVNVRLTCPELRRVPIAWLCGRTRVANHSGNAVREIRPSLGASAQIFGLGHSEPVR